MAIIDRQLPFEYTIASRSTDVMVNAVYDAHNDVACLMLGSMTPGLHGQLENSSPYEMLQELKSIFDKQTGVEQFDLIQTFHCKHEEGKLVSSYVLKMKGYVEQLKRLGYVLPQDISVGLILNGLTSDFAGFVRNYNMHNMGKTIGKLHALLIEYEKGLPKKAATPQVMAIQGGRTRKPIRNRLMLKAKLKEKARERIKVISLSLKTLNLMLKSTRQRMMPATTSKRSKLALPVLQGLRGERELKQGALYLCMGNGIRAQVEAIGSDDLVLPNVLVIYYEFLVSKNYVLYFNVIPSNGIYEIDMLNLVPNVNSIYNDSYFITFTDDYSHYGYVSLLKHKHEVFETFKVFKNESRKLTRKDYKGTLIRSRRRIHSVSERRNRTLLDMVRSMMNLTTMSLSFWDYALETATRILNMVLTKKVDKTPYELWAEELEEIQDKDTSPSKNTSEIPIKVEGLEEHSLGDLNEPNNYKAAILDMESDKWVNVMNAEMQSMKDNQVWCLFDLPPNGKTVGSKWLFKKKIDMNGIAHTYKACLVAKAIAAFYDYEIWQMDVKIAFLNSYLNEDIYTVQPEGNHIPSLQSVKSYLGKCFAMKDLEEASFILGIKIYRDRSKRLIRLSQNAYMDKILKRFRMDTSKRGYIPMQERLDLNKTQDASTPEEVKRMQNVLYASAVGSIMCTNPAHWTAVKTILKYLRNTEDVFLVYGGNPKAELRVDCYCDAGFETDRDDIKSQTRYVFILNGGAVDWKSSKQNTTAMSATEAEYIAASEAAMEAVWIRKFILRLGIVPIINEPIKIFYDNSAALLIANEQGV
ncbi:retrotransposon protein, putative, ty1-copia subclass [Tanacetum coccineum]